MINQSVMADFMSKSLNTIAMSKSNSGGEIKTNNINTERGFKQSLSSALESHRAIQNQRKPMKKYEIKEEQSAPKINTFKDAVNEQKNVTNKRPQNIKKSNSMNSKDLKTEEVDERKVKILQETLAELFGISVDEVKKVMESINLDIKELASGKNMEDLGAKLDQIPLADNEDKKIMFEIIAMAVKSLEEDINANESGITSEDIVSIFNDTTKEDQNFIVSPQEKTVKESDTKDVKDIKEVVQKIQGSIENLKGKMNVESEEGELSDIVIKGIEMIVTDKVKEVKQNLFTIKEVEMEVEVEGEKATESIRSEMALSENQRGEENGSNMGNAGKEGSKDSLKESTSPETVSFNLNGTNEDEITQFNGTINNSNEIKGISGKKETHSVPVSKKEIVNQVIEKAKVVIDGDKSEMVIDLKPDHLGKLSLKVVTERGLVVAKFIAESEQVKAALETNMNLLKESLEKQGLAVQNFSVSVGGDSSKGFNREKEQFFNENIKHNLRRTGSAVKISGTINEIESKVNPYISKDTSIDLTA